MKDIGYLWHVPFLCFLGKRRPAATAFDGDQSRAIRFAVEGGASSASLARIVYFSGIALVEALGVLGQNRSEIAWNDVSKSGCPDVQTS